MLQHLGWVGPTGDGGGVGQQQLPRLRFDHMEAGAGDPDHLPRGDHGPVQGQHEVLVHLESRRRCDGHLEHDPTGAGDVQVDIRGHRSFHRISLGHDANRVRRRCGSPNPHDLLPTGRSPHLPARDRRMDVAPRAATETVPPGHPRAEAPTSRGGALTAVVGRVTCFAAPAATCAKGAPRTATRGSSPPGRRSRCRYPVRECTGSSLPWPWPGSPPRADRPGTPGCRWGERRSSLVLLRRTSSPEPAPATPLTARPGEFIAGPIRRSPLQLRRDTGCGPNPGEQDNDQRSATGR